MYNIKTAKKGSTKVRQKDDSRNQTCMSDSSYRAVCNK